VPVGTLQIAEPFNVNNEDSAANIQLVIHLLSPMKQGRANFR